MFAPLFKTHIKHTTMRKLITLMMAVLLFASTQSFAQSRSKVKGIVKDASGKTIEAATVSLLKAKDSSLVKADVTDKTGVFEIIGAFAADKYFVTVSSVGFVAGNSAIFDLAEGQTVELPAISIAEGGKELQSVTVKARKPMIEVKADKTVFNVEASINATGSDAFELLRKSPGVVVDKDDNVSMKGKNGVRIYVDGKMSNLDNKDLAAYLKSLNSADIEAIEMISNPSAKYDASGNAGIINIRLKKNKKYGTNGNVSVGFNQGITPKVNSSFALNYRDKKVNVFGNYSNNFGRNENDFKLYRIQNDTIYDQQSIMINDNQSHNLKTGFDWFLDSRQTLGAIVNVNLSDGTGNNDGVTNILYRPTKVFQKVLKAGNELPNSRTNLNFNLNYRFVDTTGTELNVDLDHGIFRGTGRSTQPNFYYGATTGNPLYYIINKNYTPTDIDIYTGKLDYERNAFKGKFGAGVKFAYVKTYNLFDFSTLNQTTGIYVKDLQRSNKFTYTENVNAAYVNYNRQVNEKLSLQAGLRLEQTNSEGVLDRADGRMQADDRVKRNYLDFFPSAALTYNMSEKHSFNLTYSRRIDRPGYQDLNPFENKIDELTFEKGNAFLQPQYTNSFELTHTFMGFINSTLGYSHITDYATIFTDTTNGNATFIQNRNLANQDVISLNVGAPLPIKEWWNGYVNLNYNISYFKGSVNNKAVDLTVPNFNMYMENTFTIGKGWSAQMSGWFSGPSIWGGTFRSKSMGNMDIGLQKQLFDNNATLKFTLTDVFLTNRWYAISDFGGSYLDGNGGWESRQFRVNFSYRFGSNQIKSKRERKTGLETEAGRIKGGQN
jgi:iron complex outermembrane recepter protein